MVQINAFNAASLLMADTASSAPQNAWEKQMPNLYAKGRRAEYRARKQLEDEGYAVIRSAGSKGPWDLVAYRPTHWWSIPAARMIQVKSYQNPPSETAIDRLLQELNNYPIPGCFGRELWVYIKGNSIPTVYKPSITGLFRGLNEITR